MLRSGLLLLIPALVFGATGLARQGRNAVEQRGASPSTRSAAVGAEFTVMTYNVQGRPVLDDTSHKFDLISPRLNDHDIVAIQECFQDHDLLWEQATHRTKFYHGELKTPWRAVGSGLSTLARFPLLAVETEFFRSASELQNKLASKGVVLLRLDVGGMTLDVYNAHLDAGSSLTAQQSRREQGRQIVDFVGRHSPPGHSVLFVGDFNMSPRRADKHWRAYEPRWYVSRGDMLARTDAFDRLLQDLAMRDASDEIRGPVMDDVDRVLYRAGEGQILEPLEWRRAPNEFVDADGRPLSDHTPVIVRMRLAPTQAAPAR